ncbi:MAG: type II toxin-antitoxin system RelE/ParE family toxin [Heliobacteriaceae bacterium]|jgi:proteic killer suppression protein|nr:type II toxin-antitoxin system RelE/ParE family toxin [Heliobacteriaceae bacterium]
MIKSFKHKGLEKFFLTGSLKGIQAIHAGKLSRILTSLNKMKNLEQLNTPAYNLHPLKGELKGLWSITVQANWRITFKFEDENVYIVDYQDYH